MAICGVCNQERRDGELRKIYTARELARERGPEAPAYGGGTQAKVTTTYGEFQEHDFFVCESCLRQRDRLAKPLLIGLTLALVAGLVAVTAITHFGWAYLGALLVLIGGLVWSDLVSTDYRLKRLAKQQRGPGLPVEAFNEKGFRKLMEK